MYMHSSKRTLSRQCGRIAQTCESDGRRHAASHDLQAPDTHGGPATAANHAMTWLHHGNIIILLPFMFLRRNYNLFPYILRRDAVCAVAFVSVPMETVGACEQLQDEEKLEEDRSASRRHVVSVSQQ